MPQSIEDQADGTCVDRVGNRLGRPLRGHAHRTEKKQREVQIYLSHQPTFSPQILAGNLGELLADIIVWPQPKEQPFSPQVAPAK